MDEYELGAEEAQQDRLAEERRRRRQAILAKHQSSEKAETAAGPGPGTLSAQAHAQAASPPSTAPRISGPSAAEKDALAAKRKAESPAPEAGGANGSGDEVSAAEYDPSMDRELQSERLRQAEAQVHAQEQDGKEAGRDPSAATTRKAPADIGDMFSLDATDDVLDAPLQAATGASNAVDDADDPEGYYRITLGETLDDGRYHVFANLGKGMFSAVVRARDTKQDNKEVAIKIVRSQETMYKAGIKEMAVLKKIADADPDDKRHVVRLLGHFMHRNHLCMVFEALSMNLREVVRRFGKDVGLNLRAVKAYAHQMFLALSLIRKLNIMHADLKPDNILVNEAKTILKVCDLGSASDLSEMEITPYLVSRFYRAPEIILGLPYDCALDMWSMGCTLYELYTGKILFPGRSNNQMLFMMQELKGKFTAKQARRGKFGEVHFDETNTFLLHEVDRATGQPTVRRIGFSQPKQDLKARLAAPSMTSRLPADEARLLNNFVDLLGKTLELDPAKRLTPKEALSHPFLS